MKKIIIIGLGNMGLAHLTAFTKKGGNKKRLFLVEKNKERRKRICKSLKEKKIDYEILKNVPKNKIFDFAVVASKSIERINICKKLIKNNKIKFLFLEKFLFNSLREYNIFKSLQSKFGIKTYVNIWAKIFLKRVNLKKPKKKFICDVILPNGKVLTNIIHFFEIFRLLTNWNFKLDLTKFNIKKINNHYHDGYGIIKFISLKGSEMIIRSKNMSNDIIIIYQSDKKKVKIFISRGKIYINKKSKKIIKKFPLASIETKLFFDSLMKKNKKHQIFFPRYSVVEKSSKTIINSFYKKFKTKVRIT